MDKRKPMGVAIVVFLAFFIVIYIVIWNSDRPAPPHIQIPNIAVVTASFRAAKDCGEQRATIAKGKLRRHRLREGADLYIEAMAAHNRAIVAISQAIEVPNDAFTEEQLQAELSGANAAHTRFLDWYRREVARVRNSTGADEVDPRAFDSVPYEAYLDGAAIILDVLKEVDARAAEVRKSLRDELRRCEWRRWDEL